MSAIGAYGSVIFMLFIFLFGSRDAAKSKDYFYLNPSFSIRRLLYIRRIPMGKIALNSLAMQCLMIITVVLQILSLMGTNIVVPLMTREWFGKYTFNSYNNHYFQTVFCVGGIFFPGAMIILIYILVSGLFSRKRNDT